MKNQITAGNTQGAGRRKRGGFTLIEIMIVVTIIGILLAIAVPNFTRSRETTYRKSCTANLRKIQYAKDSYMMDNNLSHSTPAATFSDANLYGTGKYLKAKPECPGGGTYLPNDGPLFPTCDYGGGGVHLIVD